MCILLLWLGGVALTFAGHAAMLRTDDEKQAHGPIAIALRGFVALHLAEAAGARPVLLVPAIAYYALFEWVLASRPEKSQV